MTETLFFALNNALLVPVVGERKVAILAVCIFFIASLLTSYVILALTTQRTYSIPSNKANYSSSTMGGEALVGIENDESPMPGVPVFLGPRPGATNVSLDTVVYVYQPRPVRVDLHLDPETTFSRIKNEDDPPFSRNTIFYPAELLQPNTTYNVSGSISGYSAWWTFTTASSVIPQTEYEYISSPHAWWIAIIAASIATLIFVTIIWRINLKTNKLRMTKIEQTKMFSLFIIRKLNNYLTNQNQILLVFSVWSNFLDNNA